MRILGFGTYDTTKHPRVGILLEGLRAAGDDVVEANRPLGFSTAARVAMLSRPWTAHRLVRRLSARWWAVSRDARRARRAGPFDAVIVGYLGHFDVILARVLFPRDTIVLDLLVFAADTARDRGLAGGPRARLLALLDTVATRRADRIVVDTPEHRELLPPARRAGAVVVPVGAPAAWFAVAGSSPERGPEDPLRVVFFGLFTPLQGAEVIGAAELADRPDIAATMIGAGQDSERTRAAAGASAHVTWVDWVAPDALPAVVAAHDVCLGIFGTTAKAGRVVPNKVYQGAAAGCAIVTSDTAPQRRALGSAAVFVPAGDASSLAEALRRLALDRPGLSGLRHAARTRSRECFAPTAVVAPLRRALAGDACPVVTTGASS